MAALGRVRFLTDHDTGSAELNESDLLITSNWTWWS